MKTAAAPSPYASITEKQLREQIRDLTKIYGWRMAFTQFSMMSPKGFPDLCLVRPPRLIFAELKSEKGKTSPDQDLWLADLRAASPDGHDGTQFFEVYLWRPHDIVKIAEILR